MLAFHRALRGKERRPAGYGKRFGSENLLTDAEQHYRYFKLFVEDRL
jgi:hypothetical protein